jgi:hypothetical protein
MNINKSHAPSLFVEVPNSFCAKIWNHNKIKTRVRVKNELKENEYNYDPIIIHITFNLCSW